MKKILYVMLVLMSCNANKESGTSTSTTESVKSDKVVDGNEPAGSSSAGSIASGCYQMVISKDSAKMNISVDGSQVSGKLDYKRFEKDSNAGNFKGTISGDKINGWYSFQSEGMVSVRQVIFKISGNDILEGYGDIEMKGDTAYFKYPQALNYEANHPYKKVNCP